VFDRVTTRASAAALVVLALLPFTVSGEAVAGPRLRVGLVLETVAVGTVSDPFQHGAFVGLQRAVKDFHVQAKVVAPRPNGSWGPAFSYLARQRYDLVIGIGFLEVRDLARVAAKFPSTKFAILDASREAVPGRPKNVEGTVFRTEQPSFLAGYLAASFAKTRSPHPTIGSVAGFPIPTVDAFIAGYQAGAKRANPRINLLNAYALDFINPEKCKRAALAQIARGAEVVFNVAGGCGLGTLAAAKQKGIWGIGVDIDQSYLGRFILTSVIKRLDIAVYNLVRSLEQGRFRTGGNVVFDLRNDGVGLGRFSPLVTRSLQRQLTMLRAQIVRGEITVPALLK
jgi:basic membrane protein A and related proteins